MGSERSRRLGFILAAAGIWAVTASLDVPAYEINDRLTVAGVVAGAAQVQEISGSRSDAIRGGAVVFQPRISFRPSARDVLVLRLGFAVDGDLAERTPFALLPWAADLESTVENVNGRGLSHVLTASYERTIPLDRVGSVAVAAGLIDSTEFLDLNAYANDEYTQFMNEALVNAPNGFFPSYDLGVAVAWRKGRVEARAVAMGVGENADGRGYGFLGVQAQYRAETSLGTGHYRLILDRTSRDFADPTGTSLERQAAVLISADQSLGRSVGLFLRTGWQSRRAAIRFGAIYSGGVVVRGFGWGRPSDAIGVAYGHLNGGNLDLERTQVLETYYRVVVDRHLAITGDLQYMIDDAVGGGGPQGATFSLRVVGTF